MIVSVIHNMTASSSNLHYDHAVQCCAVLYCAELYSAALYCAVSTVLHCAEIYCAVPCYIILYYVIF